MESQRGIEVGPDKIKAIVEMKPLRIEKEIQGFLGLTCEPLFRLLKKEVLTV